jgi:hypothetical protein
MDYNNALGVIEQIVYNLRSSTLDPSTCVFVKFDNFVEFQWDEVSLILFQLHLLK